MSIVKHVTILLLTTWSQVIILTGTISQTFREHMFPSWIRQTSNFFFPPPVITSNCIGPCFLWWVIYHFLPSPASFFLRRSISSLSFFISLSRPSVLVPRPEPWRDCTACVDSGNIKYKGEKTGRHFRRYSKMNNHQLKRKKSER